MLRVNLSRLLMVGSLLFILVTVVGCTSGASEPLETGENVCAEGSWGSDNFARFENLIRCLDPSRLPWAAAILIGALLAYQFVSGPVTRRIGQGNQRHRLLVLKMAIMVGSFIAIVYALSGDKADVRIFLFLSAIVIVIFALKDPFSSFLAGLSASFEQTYAVDDWIEVDDHYGRVTNIGLRSLKLQTPDDSTVTVPHSRVWNSTVVNANSAQTTHMCVADFFVQRDHDFQAARHILWDVAITSPYTLIDDEHPISVMVVEQPYGLHYRVKAYPRFGEDEFSFISDLTVRGREALAALGIEMAHSQPVPASS